jgi:hypothetical protein
MKGRRKAVRKLGKAGIADEFRKEHLPNEV